MSKDKNIKNNLGFTLVEMLVAVGVMSIATLAFLPSFSRANRDKTLQQNAGTLKDAVTTVRNKALTEVNNPGSDTTYVYSGIKFTSGSSQYTVFRSNEANATVCSNLSGNVVIDGVKNFSNDVLAKIKTAPTPSEDPTCIFFEYGSGNALTTKGNGSVKFCSD